LGVQDFIRGHHNDRNGEADTHVTIDEIDLGHRSV
jgi:hypothetical protein